MDNASRYWQLVRLTGSGQEQIQTLPQVQSWLLSSFADLLASEAADTDLQAALFAHWQAQREGADLAQLSLRCWITHQIRHICINLARRYGEYHGFSAAELFPWVLDDDSQPSPSYRPLTLEILESYDPAKANLGTWSGRLTKTHSGLNRVLMEKGIYLASDWAILNDTTLVQGQRILREYHLCSEYEVSQALMLLEQYQRVYQRDRILQRQSGQMSRCPDPTPEQLAQINPAISPKVLKMQLRELASQLRQYRIHVRSGNPRLYQVHDDEELERLVGPQEDATLAGEDDQSAFLQTYREAMNRCLGEAIAQVVKTNLEKLRDRKPPQDRAYVQGLYLRQCQGLAMGKLAAQIGLSSQVQVTRLLNLKRLRSDVRHRLLPQLHQSVRQEALNYVSADRLRSLDQSLETLLAEEVDALIADAAAEAQAPKGRAVRSRFADQLCREIHAFLPEQSNG